jgi:hypothetical protein
LPRFHALHRQRNDKDAFRAMLPNEQLGKIKFVYIMCFFALSLSLSLFLFYFDFDFCTKQQSRHTITFSHTYSLTGNEILNEKKRKTRK